MGDGRRLRGHALGRPVLDGQRADRRERRRRCAARRPAGDLATLGVPATAAGPSLRELWSAPRARSASITQVALRVRPVPGRDALRGLVRALVRGGLRRAARGSSSPGSRPTSRGCPTRPRRASGWRWPGRAASRAGRAWPPLRALGYGEGCLIVLGWEGEEKTRSPPAGAPPPRCCARRGRLPAGARRGGGVGAHALRRPAPARRPARPRRAGRDARDRRELDGARLACATPWPARCAARSAGAVVGCHVSHLYPTGASLYFTVLAARDPEDPRRAVAAAKARGDATRSSPAARRSPTTTPSGATTRRGWRPSTARSGVELLRALKDRCDPAGIMNPGVLI